jgi:prepilin-type processing-associated H-X9-DG protein
VEPFANGSYGYSDWIACPPVEKNKSTYWGLPKANAWKTITVAGAARIPTFGDCADLDAAVRTGDSPDGLPEDQRPINSDAGGVPISMGTDWNRNAIRFFCIDRHNESINMAFLDASARRVGLKELWSLKWNRNYTATVPPWPKWLRKMKD